MQRRDLLDFEALPVVRNAFSLGKSTMSLDVIGSFVEEHMTQLTMAELYDL